MAIDDEKAKTKERIRKIVRGAISDNTTYRDISPCGVDGETVYADSAAEQAANEIYGMILHWKHRAERAEAKLRDKEA